MKYTPGILSLFCIEKHDSVLFMVHSYLQKVNKSINKNNKTTILSSFAPTDLIHFQNVLLFDI